MKVHKAFTVAIFAFAHCADSFAFPPGVKKPHSQHSSKVFLSKNQENPMSEASRLSHVMLKVPSVDDTVAYWEEKGGQIIASTKTEDGFYASAFVALGNGKTSDSCFALELVKNGSEKFELGNVIQYVGVSMLLQFQDNLLGPIKGEKPESQGDEPNAIAVHSSAAAPGDFFTQLCFKSNDLAATSAFYELLGMESRASDGSVICMRYDSPEGFYGVPTSLVFEATNEKLQMGNCFDHLAFYTKADVEEQLQRLESAGATVWMKPTEMFGKRLVGVKDPNGYKVVIASE